MQNFLQTESSNKVAEMPWKDQFEARKIDLRVICWEAKFKKKKEGFSERKERQNLENSIFDPGGQQLSIYPRLLSKRLLEQEKKKKNNLFWNYSNSEAEVHISLDRRACSTLLLLKCNDWWSQIVLSSSFEPHDFTETNCKAKEKKKKNNFIQPLQTSKSCTQFRKNRNKKVSKFLNLFSQTHSKLIDFEMGKW